MNFKVLAITFAASAAMIKAETCNIGGEAINVCKIAKTSYSFEEGTVCVSAAECKVAGEAGGSPAGPGNVIPESVPAPAGPAAGPTAEPPAGLPTGGLSTADETAGEQPVLGPASGTMTDDGKCLYNGETFPICTKDTGEDWSFEAGEPCISKSLCSTSPTESAEDTVEPTPDEEVAPVGGSAEGPTIPSSSLEMDSSDMKEKESSTSKAASDVGSEASDSGVSSLFSLSSVLGATITAIIALAI